MLMVLAAGIGLALVPMQFFSVEWSPMMGTLSGVGIVCGALLALLGGAMWVASLFLE
jgi:hypothetical protein